MIDLLVVGGGPAGLATAIHAAEAGLEAVVAEPRPTPIDKACGEGLMPGAVNALAGLGVTVAGHPLRGIRYLDDRHRAEALFAPGPGPVAVSAAPNCRPPWPAAPRNSACG